jgi:hypothetical protein
MHKSATKCNETIGKWCKNKHGASKIIDTLETYQRATQTTHHHQASKQTTEQRKAKTNQIKKTTMTEVISHLKGTSQQ